MRLTVGQDNTMGQIDYMLDVLPDTIAHLRSLLSAWRQKAGA
jgi:cysteine sulfinate desulfinase/cysteine desulfurase-like protein